MKKALKYAISFLCSLTLFTTMNTFEILLEVQAATHTHTDKCYNGNLHTCNGNTSTDVDCYDPVYTKCGVFSTKVYNSCGSCGGDGEKYSSGYYYDCYTCSGSGSVSSTTTTSCSKTMTTACTGSFTVTWYTCSGCGGSGYNDDGSRCYNCANNNGGDVRYYSCSTCGGGGWEPYHNSITTTCTICGGTGSVSTTTSKTCSSCGGSGSHWSSGYYYTCGSCSGSGNGSLKHYQCSNCTSTSATADAVHNIITSYSQVCGKISGCYYNGTEKVDARCNEIIVDIIPVKDTQTITTPTALNVQVYLKYLDGTTSTETYTAEAKTFDNTETYSNEIMTLSYDGLSEANGTVSTFTTDTTVTTNYMQDVHYIDKVTSTGKVLGENIVPDVAYGTEVSGSELGTSTTVGEYYEGYYFNGDYTTETIGSETVYVYRYFTPEKYKVTNIDIVGISPDGEKLGESSWMADFDSTVSGIEQGTSTIVGKYYTDYEYVNASETVVTTDGAIVYRYFKYVPFKIGTNVVVSDWYGEYDGEYHNAEITTTIPDVVIKFGTKEGTYDLNESPKYKNNGEYVVYYQVSKEGYTTLTGKTTVKILKIGANLTDVYATQSSSFIITIPKVLVLNGTDGYGAYTIEVKGNIAGTDIITVTPDSEFYMSQTGKADIKTIVTQTNTQFSYANGVTETGSQMETGRVQMESISAGKWTGLFNFNIASSVDLEMEDSIGSVEEDILNETVIGQDTAQYKESEFDELENKVEKNVR